MSWAEDFDFVSAEASECVVQVSVVTNVGASAYEKITAFEPVLKRHGITITRKILFEESATVQDMLNGGQMDEITAHSRSE